MLIDEPASHPGPSPTLETVHRIEKVLREAAAAGEGPLSFAEIARRLPVKKIRRETVKAALAELRRFHLVVVTQKGAMWVFAEDDTVWRKPRETLA